MKKILIAMATLMLFANVYAQESSQCVKDSNCCSRVGGIEKQWKVSPHHFTMSLGYGFSLSSEHDALFTNYNAEDSHNKKMRHGINYELDYDYNFHQNMAFGVFFSMYNSFDSYYANSTIESSCSDDRWLFYVGPSFMAHTDMLDNHWSLFARATVGLMNFRNSQRALNAAGTDVSSTTYKRYTLGYGLMAGADYYINKYLSVEGSLGWLSGQISKMKDNDNTYELNDNEKLGRLNINIGIKVKL